MRGRVLVCAHVWGCKCGCMCGRVRMQINRVWVHVGVCWALGCMRLGCACA
jgi:hypothetical protein